MNRSIPIAAMLALAMATAVPIGSPAERADASPDRVEADESGPIRLAVSTHSGPLPLEITLEGRLPGVGPAETKACYLNVEWTYTSPGGITLNAKKDFPCVDPPAEIPFPEKFEKTVTLVEPGTYVYRIAIEPKDGRRRVYNTQEVYAYRSHWEIGVKVSRPF